MVKMPSLRAVPRRDRWTLWVPAVGGIGLRWWEVLVGRPRCDAAQLAAASQSCLRVVGDMGYFRGQAHYLAKGHGFVNMVALTVGRSRPGAYHPPAFPTVLAGLNLLGWRSLGHHRLALSALGGVGIVLIGVIARQLGGRRARGAGLAAASIAALSPLFWLNDTQAMSESLYVPLVAVLIAALYAFWRQPSLRRAASIGALVAVITLTRAEGLAMLVLVLPLLVGMRSLSPRRRVALFGAAAGACLFVLSPWITYNLARFPHTTYLTTSAGDALLFRSCDAAFYGRSVGYYDNDCAPKPNLTVEDESAQDHRSRALALTYIGDHLGRLPVVVLARVGRMWEIYYPFENAELSGFLDNRGSTEARLALYGFWAMLAPAAYGVTRLRRRGVPISPLVGLIVLATASTALTSAVVRYRASADLALLLLAAVGISDLWSRHLRPLTRTRFSVQWRQPAGKVALSTLLLVGTLWSPLPSPASAAKPNPAAGRSCDQSDSLSRLLDAFNARAAAAPAARLRVGAPPRIQADIDLVLSTDGDILRLAPAELQRVVHELAEHANDSCSLFGVW